MSSNDRILQMVKARNHPTYPLTPDTVSLTGLVVENNADSNTRVTMRSKGAWTGYTGQVDLHYIRVNLSVLGTIQLIREEQFTFDEVIAAINAMKKSQITSVDFTNTGLPTISNGVPTNILLSASNDSLAWLGNVQITVLNGIPAKAPDLVDFFNNKMALPFE